MTVYVDPLFRWPNAPAPFRQGSCHMWADTEEELHELARRIGMRRAWFQEHPLVPHYDLTPARRELALQLGAHAGSMREHLRAIRSRNAESKTP